MSEKIKVSSNEKNTSILEAAGEQSREKLEKRLEKEITPDNRAEKSQEATHEALEIATKHEEAQRQAEKEKIPKGEKRRLTKKDIDASYKKTLDSVQRQLSPSSRAFSRVIHNPVVEKTSEVVGNTIARPNLVIAGALGAIASIVVYLVAKRYGYVLSGFETIALFVIGWCIGAVIEYARVGFLNKKDI